MRRAAARIETSRGEIRRLTPVLRRLLVDGGTGILEAIAAPRIGRISLTAPDNKSYYDLERHCWYVFFSSGRVGIFTAKSGPLVYTNFGQPPQGILKHDWAARQGRLLQKAAEGAGGFVTLRVNNFCEQRVLCYMGRWATRRSIIQYVARVADGVHSGAPENDSERLIEQMRTSCSYRVNGDTIEVDLMPELGPNRAAMQVALPQPLPETFQPSSIDPVLLEVLATAQHLVDSPDVARLEEAIKSE